MLPSNIISLGSLVGAVLAVIYARRAWTESQRANALSMHSHKLEIYKAFCSLKLTLCQRGILIESAEVAQFYSPLQNAEFYFSKGTFERISRYFEICFALSELTRKLQRSGLAQEQIEDFYSKQDRLRKDELSLSAEVECLIKKELYTSTR